MVIGKVLSVEGSQASVGLLTLGRDHCEDVRTTVGKFLSVRSGTSTLIGLITHISVDTPISVREPGYYAAARLDLMGEIKADERGVVRFQRGITDYPLIGDAAIPLGPAELRIIYGVEGKDSIDVGVLQQDSSIRAYINVEQMLSKHFAVLGTTGVGKSSGVALLLQQVLAAKPDLRIFLLDGHNEYAKCFGDKAQVLNPRNLRLPFWLFNFEEMVDVILGGRPGAEDEMEILAEVIPLAKGAYTQYRGASDRMALKKSDPKTTGFTADTPVPYRLADMIALIDERMGKLENRTSRMTYHKLMARIEMVSNDPRYTFMFENANVGGDTMAEVLCQLFRLPPNGKPMTIMQLAGFPAEVIDSVVSVLGRMAFDFGLWSDGAFPMLFVCEEAHRYAAADKSIGFGPTRRSLSRIAKEGRKYGVFLGLVSQRPAELDATIVSQCSTLFAMRMANDRDQAIIRSAVSDAAANLLGFLPSLSTREVLAFGEGVALPARIKFGELPKHLIPNSEALTARASAAQMGDEQLVHSVIARWRGASLTQKQRFDEEFNNVPLAPQHAGPQAPSIAPERYSILKKPIEAPATSPAPTTLRTPGGYKF